MKLPHIWGLGKGQNMQPFAYKQGGSFRELNLWPEGHNGAAFSLCHCSHVHSPHLLVYRQAQLHSEHTEQHSANLLIGGKAFIVWALS